jgi:hypothetical protein
MHISTKPAAEALGLTVSTVKSQLRTLRHKFGVTSNVQLICAAAARDILDIHVTPYALTGRTCLGPTAGGVANRR